MAERDGGRDFRDRLDQFVLDALVHDDAGAGVTGFSRVVVDAPGDARGSRFDVGVHHHHVRALAAALEGDALHVRFAGIAQHQLADLGGAGEAHHVDIAMERQRFAGLFAITRDDIQHTRRQAGFAAQLTQADRREGRLLGGFQDHGVTGEKCRSELPRADDERVIPGHHRRNDAERLTPYERQFMGRRRGDLIVEFVRELRVVGDAICRERDVDIDRVQDRLAHIECLEDGQAIDVISNELREPVHHALAGGRIGTPPASLVKRRTRRDHRRVDISGTAASDLGDDLTVDRAYVFENPAVAGSDELAVDERPSFRTRGGGELLPILAVTCGGRGHG